MVVELVDWFLLAWHVGTGSLIVVSAVVATMAGRMDVVWLGAVGAGLGLAVSMARASLRRILHREVESSVGG